MSALPSSYSDDNNHDIFFTGKVGEIDDGYYVWTHKKFDIGYNEKQIVDVNLTSENKVKLEPGVTLSFSYEVLLQILY